MADNIIDLLVRMKADTSQYTAALDEAVAKTEGESGSMVSALSAIGGGVVLGALALAAAGVAAIGTACINGITDASNFATSLHEMGTTLGTSAETSSALAFAVQTVGGNVDSFTNSFGLFARGLETARGTLGTTGLELQNLGINIYDANGNLLPMTTIIESVADKLSAMPDGLEKSRTEMLLFGRSGRDMNDVMNELANGGLEAAGAQAAALGLTMSDAQESGILKFNYALNDLKLGVQGILIQLGTQLIPVIKPLVDNMLAWLASPEIQAGLHNLVTGIASFVQTVVNNIPNVIKWFTQAFDFLKNNQGIVVAVLAVLGVAVAAFAVTIISSIISMIAAALPVVAVIALIGGIVYLLYQAWTTDFGGIQEKTSAVFAWLSGAFTTVRDWLAVAIPQAINFLVGMWNFLKTEVERVWNLIKPIVAAATTYVQGIIQTFIDLIHGNWYKFGEDLRKDIENAWTLIKTIFSTAWSDIKAIVSNLITDVVNFFTTTDWGQVGRNVITGIVHGLQAAGGAVLDFLKGLARDALNAIMGFFGIHSPSTVMAEVGYNMMSGLAIGVSENAHLPRLATLQAANNVSTTYQRQAQYSFTYQGNATAQQVLQSYEMARLMD